MSETFSKEEIEILKKNIFETHKELNAAYKRIAELNEQIIALQREQSVNLGRS